MKAKIFLFAALLCGAVIISSFNKNELIGGNSSAKKHSPAKAKNGKKPLPGVYEGEFSVNSDDHPGQPFKVYVNPSNRSIVTGCIAVNNPPGNNKVLPASGSYSNGSVVGFSCTYAVYGVTPPENNTVNYSGALNP